MNIKRIEPRLGVLESPGPLFQRNSESLILIVSAYPLMEDCTPDRGARSRQLAPSSLVNVVYAIGIGVPVAQRLLLAVGLFGSLLYDLIQDCQMQ